MTVVILIFAVIAALDYIIGSKFGLGKEFEKAFSLLGNLILSMVGMIVLAPLLADWLSPVFTGFYSVLGLDPSIIPASLFANDMGGASLATEIAINKEIGMFNGLVVASMMGCTVSFTIPFALGAVKKENHSVMLMGLLCGIITIPVGCFVSGLLCGLGIKQLLLNLLPLVLLSAIICIALLIVPNVCIKIFKILGIAIRTLIIMGLVAGILNFIVGKEIIRGIAPIDEGVMICFNAAVVMAGMLPIVFIASKLLAKPLGVLGRKLGINEMSTLSFFSTLAVSFVTFGNMDKMDKKGMVLNSAFAVSAAFVLADHLAFTMAFNASFLPYVVVGKLVAGALSLVLASVFYEIKQKRNKKSFE